MVRGPQRAERVGLGGQLSDQVDQGLVVGVAGSGGVEEGNVVAGRLFPVAVEVVGPWGRGS